MCSNGLPNIRKAFAMTNATDASPKNHDGDLFARMFGAGWAAIGGTIGGLSAIGDSETIVVY